MSAAFSEAFAKAGYDPSSSRLYSAATNILQATRNDFGRASARLEEIIESDRKLRRALVLHFLRFCYNDMQRLGLRGVGHERDDAHVSVAHPTHPSQELHGGGQSGSGLQTTNAPSVQPNEEKTPRPRALRARLRVVSDVAATVLDTLKVRDGRSVGDLRWHELEKIARSNEKEARVLRYIADHVANAPSDARVRDLVPAEVVVAAIAHAEAVNVA